MKLTALDLMVIYDTLNVSLSIKDGGRLFNFTSETRDAVAKKIVALLHKTEIAEIEELGE